MNAKREVLNLDDISSKPFPNKVEEYNQYYADLKERIKEARINGKDTFIAELNIHNFKAKLHIAEVTREEKDFDIVKTMLVKVEKELKEAKEENMVDIREEIDNGAKRLMDEESKKIS